MTPLEQKQKELIEALYEIIGKNDSFFSASLMLKAGKIQSEIASLENQSEPEQITDDLKQYVTNLLYYAYAFNDKNKLVCDHAFDEWAEEQTDNIDQFMQSRLSLQAKETLRDELIKFADYWNGRRDIVILDEDIDEYLNSQTIETKRR